MPNLGTSVLISSDNSRNASPSISLSVVSRKIELQCIPQVGGHITLLSKLVPSLIPSQRKSGLVLSVCTCARKRSVNVSVNVLSHKATSSMEVVYEYGQHKNYFHNQNNHSRIEIYFLSATVMVAILP